MGETTAPPEQAAVQLDVDRLTAAVRDARDDAAPFALAAAGILIALGIVSMHAHWDLLGHRLWWMWLVVAVEYRHISVRPVDVFLCVKSAWRAGQALLGSD